MTIKFDKNYQAKKRINQAQAGAALYKMQGHLVMNIKDGWHPSIEPRGSYLGLPGITIQAGDFLKATEILKLYLTDPDAARERYGGMYWKDHPQAHLGKG